MKKVLALVLALVMVCTLAMAAATPDKFDLYKANSDNLKNGKLKTTAAPVATLTEITPVAAVTYDNGTGTLAYLKINGEEYVKTTAPTVADFAVTKAGKTDILYYVTAVTDVEYDATAKEFTDFGSKCGQILRNDINAKYYVLTNSAKEGDVYKYNANGTFYVLVDGKVIKTSDASAEVKDHTWVVSKVGLDKDNNTIPTEVSCPVCGLKTTAIYKYNTQPAGTDLENIDGVYGFVVPTTTAAATTTNPDTGANDVIGVAAALAVVALVSGAAISLKK